MASRSSRRVYRQIGVFLPVERESEDQAIDPLQRVMDDSVATASDSAIMDAGFLYVHGTSLGAFGKFNVRDGTRLPELKSLCIVQSAATGELFMNKLLERPWDPNTHTSHPPLELRCSTYPHRIGDSTVDRPANLNVGPYGVVRKGMLPDVPYFNKLRFWQELEHGDRDPHNVTVFSLYFEFCNGGTLEDIISHYQDRLKAIPEHFIWHVAEHLFLAIVAMKFGRYTVEDDDGRETTIQTPNWTRIYHRDLVQKPQHANNVFINWIPKGPGRIPRVGLANNAFPEIVIGDFGNAGVQGDDPATLPQCVYQPMDDDDQDDDGYLYDWEDIFSSGEMLRRMAMTHTATGNIFFGRPNNLRMDDANREPTAPPYSAALINMLKRFEFDDMENTTVRDIGDDAAINAAFPSPQTVRNTLLPLAKRKVLSYLDPAGKAAGYFDTIDVSWTRPAELMPFSYIMKYATDAGELADGRPPPDDDSSDGDGDGDDDDDGDGDGDDNGDGDGDHEMSDSPPAPQSAQDGADGADGADDAHDANDGSQQPGSPAGGSGGGDGDDTPSDSPPPPPLPADQLAMRELSKLHKWNTAKPRYQLRTLEFGVPTIVPLKYPPP